MKNIYLLLLLMLLHMSTTAQISEKGNPASFNDQSSKYRLSATPHIPVKEYPVMDTILLSKTLKNAYANCPTCKNNFYSYIKEIHIDILKEASTYVSNGTKIWQYSIKANNAKGLQLYFNSFQIPTGGKLFIYNKDRSMLLGAYTEANNTDGGNYALQPILGNEIIIEYNAPLNAINCNLQINEIGYLFTDSIEKFGVYSVNGSEDCEYDVASSYGWGWEKEIRSVACMLVPYKTDDGQTLSGVCSGALINNSFQDNTPYFLTAEHGIRDGLKVVPDPGKFVFAFNYQNINSGYDNPLSTTQTVSGCKVLVKQNAQTSSDYALLLLNETPPASYNVCYAGWDYSEQGANYSTTNTGIHHPGGDFKKISISLGSLVSEAADEAGPEANFWRLSWTNGITEKGSSGSPLFNNQHKIIGQLYGGYSDCNTNGPDWYGKFSNSWIDGNFAYFLRPTPIPLTSVDTYCPVYNVQCSNGIKDGNETGIDCGGSLCPPCKPTCTDGIKNGNETQVDCGGSCAPCAPTCFDQIRNQGETQVDCGGPCIACVAPSCTDNWKNQSETGVDCGGPCQPCVNLCNDGKLNGDEIDIDCGGSCQICDGIITTNATTNGHFENLACAPVSGFPYMSFGFNTDNKCVAGAWYASHGMPRIENWNQETPLNHSLALSAKITSTTNQGDGIFYQLPANLDPTAEYTLHYKKRFDGDAPVHALEFYATNGLRQSSSAQTSSPPVPPAVAAQWVEPTYAFDKYRISQDGWAETTKQTVPWYNWSFTFTVPTGIYNQIWITAKNTYQNASGWASIVYLDDFILTVSKPGTQPLNCSTDITFTNVLPEFAKAQNSITVKDVNFAANQTAVLRAGNTVRFTPGFHAYKGCDLIASIASCDAPENPVVRSNRHLNYVSTSDILTNDDVVGDGLQLLKRNTEAKQATEITIFPNPTEGKFTISSTNTLIDAIQVLNIYGSVINKEKYNQAEQAEIDISAQNAGTYIIQVFSEGKIYSKKIILVH